MEGVGHDMSDQQLLEQFRRSGDNRWLGILFERYTLVLYGLCLKYLREEEEARDAVQQIFLQAYTALQRTPVEYFRSWIYMVARNCCLMRIRSRPQVRTTEIREEHHPVVPEVTFPKIEQEKQLELLRQSLEELGPEQRQCLTLFYLEKRSYREIARLTGCSLMQVKSYIQNGKRNLRQLMQQKLKTP